MEKTICIIGAGLVGSLLSILLAREGFEVKVFEKRQDPLAGKTDSGRSINLALSYRGIKALTLAGVADKALKIAIPMKGRMLHEPNGKLLFQPYGKEGQVINSISRSELNKLLIEEARQNFKVQYYFNHRLDSIDIQKQEMELTDTLSEKSVTEKYQVLFGADGAFSAVRSILQRTDRFDYSQKYLEYGYKELHINPDEDNNHRMEVNALHIWPRENFMLIALPNLDGSFTVTLFLPFEGPVSFEKLKTDEDVTIFFSKYFADALALMPDLASGFFKNPTSSLVTVHCFPWVCNNSIALIGDAAHAIVPFYGQGMNAGFEDCRVLVEILKGKKTTDWSQILNEYQKERKENSVAIATLALRNFEEMRDLVADEKFLLRKKIEARIHQKYPEYLPLYSMVTFSDYTYKNALETGNKQDILMAEIMKIEGIEEFWDKELFWERVKALLNNYFEK